MESTENKFAFLVHPRDLNDFLIKFPLLRILPNKSLLWLTKILPPVVVSKITGLTSKEGKPIEGHIIAITLTARQMIEDRELALKKIVQAVKFAHSKGVRIIGFGALTASFSKGGLDLTDKVNDIGITTGRAYTVKTVTDYAKKCIEDFKLDKSKVRIAVVGAAGSIGSGCAKVLARYGVEHITLIDLERKLENLKNNVSHIKTNHGNVRVEISHKIGDIKDHDIIIAATNSPEVLIKSEDLSPGAIVINDAQPSDVSPEIVESRRDVLIIEGGVIHTPGIKCNFNLGLAGREDTFCCLGEVLILARNNHHKHFALGELDLPLIEEIEKMSDGMIIQLARFQNAKGYIEEGQIQAVGKLAHEMISART